MEFYLVALALKVFGPVERVDARLDITGQGIDRTRLTAEPSAGRTVAAVDLIHRPDVQYCGARLLRRHDPASRSLSSAQSVISTRRMANRRTAPQDPNLPLRRIPKHRTYVAPKPSVAPPQTVIAQRAIGTSAVWNKQVPSAAGALPCSPEGGGKREQRDSIGTFLGHSAGHRSGTRGPSTLTYTREQGW